MNRVRQFGITLGFVLFSRILTAQSLPADERAIRVVIEREAQAYLNRNATEQANCWATHTELSQRVSLGDGRVVVGQGEQTALRRGLTSSFRQMAEPDSSMFINRDYRIRIRGDAAFVTFGQIMRCHGRPTAHSQQVRYLEREGGQWKIVHAGVMYFEPEPAVDR